MRARRVAAALCPLVLVLGGCGDPEQAPDEVVQDYLDARVEGDCDAAAATLAEGSDVADCGEFETVGEGPHPTDHEVDGDRAAVEVTDYFECSLGDEDLFEYADTFHLVLEDGEWRIDDVEVYGPTDDDCIG